VLYLLDANVLIDADRDFYQISRVPEFWQWLLYHGQQGNIKLCLEVYEEVTDAEGDLPDLLKTDQFKEALRLPGECEQQLVDTVVTQGYAPDLTDVELVTIGRDPFLIAHALSDMEKRCVVTTETAAPSKKRQNRKVPDVCKQFKIPCITAFHLYRLLNFATDWKPASK
jgi:hypothetical protein